LVAQKEFLLAASTSSTTSNQASSYYLPPLPDVPNDSRPPFANRGSNTSGACPHWTRQYLAKVIAEA
jgi:hypothetical protein